MATAAARGLGRVSKVLPVTQFPAQTLLTLSPPFEPSRDRAQQTSLRGRVLLGRGAREETRAQLCIPSDVVSSAHLVLKEPCQKETLRAGGFHHRSIQPERGVEHEMVEDRAQRFRRGNLAVGLR